MNTLILLLTTIIPMLTVCSVVITILAIALLFSPKEAWARGHAGYDPENPTLAQKYPILHYTVCIGLIVLGVYLFLGSIGVCEL